MTTEETLAVVGARLRAYRLRQNRTVEDIAKESGLGRATVLRAEAGENPNIATIVRILRALGRIDALELFLPEPLVSPIELAAHHGRERQRARKPRHG